MYYILAKDPQQEQQKGNNKALDELCIYNQSSRKNTF